MNKLAILSIVGLLLISIGYNSAFAKTWEVTMPTGAGDPTSSESRLFYSPPEITIELNDEVEWGNADTVTHTVTSGNPTDGSDGTFDSSFLGVGESFSYTFNEPGTFDYYCTLHLWMTGTINVASAESGMKVFNNVGEDAGDGQTTFDIEYSLDKILADVTVNEDQKALTFTMAGVGTDDDTFVVKLPKDLVGGELLVWVDNVQVTDFEQVDEGGINTLTIPLTAQSEIVTVVGTSVVPEFGAVAALILAVAIIATITVSTRLHLPRF